MRTRLEEPGLVLLLGLLLVLLGPGDIHAAGPRGVAQGGGFVELPPSGDFQVHRHSFALSLLQDDIGLQLQYHDHHEGAASTPIHGEPTALSIHMSGLLRFTRGAHWAYFEGLGVRWTLRQGQRPGLSTEFVCVWIEDGRGQGPDRFHLETAPRGSVPGYTSGGVNIGCTEGSLPPRFILPADDGYVVGGGNVTLFPTAFSAAVGPYLDAHLHVIRNFSVEEMSAALARFWRAGVSGVVLFGGPRQVDLLQTLQAQYPDYIFPFIQTGRDPATKQLLLGPTAVNEMREQLETGLFRGIGELTLRHRPFPNSPPDGDANNACGDVANGNHVDAIYKLGAEFKVPVNVHVEHNLFDDFGHYGLFGEPPPSSGPTWGMRRPASSSG
ncbi:MAG: hypothetical protein HYV08_01375 [Deltaproteobacteria bacterium]|nr:hypothetical protein [Deltaproteobacteria bacterium]